MVGMAPNGCYKHMVSQNIQVECSSCEATKQKNLTHKFW
jgi:hypothetical protein